MQSSKNTTPKEADMAKKEKKLVEVGSFPYLKDAEELIAEYAKKGIEARITERVGRQYKVYAPEIKEED